jgi:hypothetical protein
MSILHLVPRQVRAQYDKAGVSSIDTPRRADGGHDGLWRAERGCDPHRPLAIQSVADGGAKLPLPCQFQTPCGIPRNCPPVLQHIPQQLGPEIGADLWGLARCCKAAVLPAQSKEGARENRTRSAAFWPSGKLRPRFLTSCMPISRRKARSRASACSHMRRVRAISNLRRCGNRLYRRGQRRAVTRRAYREWPAAFNEHQLIAYQRPPLKDGIYPRARMP